MAESKLGGGLQVIFSIFLGLMVTAFIGVGGYTFHPPPDKELNKQIEDLNRQEQSIRTAKSDADLSDEDRTRLQEIDRGRNDLRDAIDAAMEPWRRSTSIILIVLATLTMAVSLVRAERLPVISNGLLLGGLFTMVYGVGWIIATDASVGRFVVMTAALVITIGLGYARFVRGQAGKSSTETAVGQDIPGLADVDRRLRDIEARMNEASAALGRKEAG